MEKLEWRPFYKIHGDASSTVFIYQGDDPQDKIINWEAFDKLDMPHVEKIEFAKRLCAIWNATVGYPTEELEELDLKAVSDAKDRELKRLKTCGCSDPVNQKGIENPFHCWICCDHAPEELKKEIEKLKAENKRLKNCPECQTGQAHIHLTEKQVKDLNSHGHCYMEKENESA